MFLQLGFLGFVSVSIAARTQQLVAFDAASASSTYSAGNLAGSPAFAAQQALSGGSGYWLHNSVSWLRALFVVGVLKVFQRESCCGAESRTQLHHDRRGA